MLIESRQQKLPWFNFFRFSSGKKEQERLQESQQEAKYQEKIESFKQQISGLNHQTKTILSQIQEQKYRGRLRLDE